MRAAALAVVLGLLGASTATTSEGWLRFRGPNGSGIAEVSGLPTDLSPERAQWRVEVPFGHSSPIVVGGLVVVTALVGDELVTLAVDESTGAERWRRSVPRRRVDRIAPETGPAVATPTSDGASVYSFFPEFGLVAYGLAGDERWRLELPPFESYYGMASSPVLEAGTLILLCDQSRRPFLLGIDAATGRELWRRQRDVTAESWTTPMVRSPGSDRAAVLVFGTAYLDAYSPRTGDRLWRLPGFGFTPVASPIVSGDVAYVLAPDQAEVPPPSVEATFALDRDGDGKLTEQELAPSPYAGVFHWLDKGGDGLLDRREYAEQIAGLASPDHGLVAVDLASSPPKELWRQRKSLPWIATPILYRDVLFLVRDGGILTSYDPHTGKVLKRGRIEGALDGFSPSPVAADGKLYLASSGGKIAVVAAEADWTTLAVSDLDESIFASPAIAGGRMFVRTRSKLYAFGKAD
ncbi:MAG TPA: PQQ-binding-like beta-propeller repeat protein [Thermoanaerobaculia bacterium]|nr:PQQ-binding-like beta-propeller repeat protein [Thermoanaerobaculia bacterium]